MTLQDQLRAFALARGGKLRTGPQPHRPEPPSIGQSEPMPTSATVKPLADPYIEFTDDYSLWSRSRRGE